MGGVNSIKIEVARIKMLEHLEQNQSLLKPEKNTPSKEEIKYLEQKKELVIMELRQRDREVRAHEQAHLVSAGPYARGGPRYEYIRGPDGRLYAISGEVKIDTSPVPGDPKATLEKARTIKRAALAPMNPSPQDRIVAAKADRMAMEAEKELQEKQMQLIKEKMRQQAINTYKNNIYSAGLSFLFPLQTSLDTQA